MEKVECEARQYNSRVKYQNAKNQKIKDFVHKFIMTVIVLGIWQITAMHFDNSLLMPYPIETLKAFIFCITDKETVINILITLQRVLKGFVYAMIFGLPLGFLMGFSKDAQKLLGSFIDSIRQVPIMAWVPLTIVWFGIGDGPTIFLIAFSGVFPIILNTIQGVRNISKDYYNAAKSMGASRLSIFIHIIVPASIPDILTGARIAISSGWMSVIWAEFIATSAGLGYSMVQAQTRMQTEMLVALMFFAALVGFGIDKIIQFINKSLTRWRVAE